MLQVFLLYCGIVEPVALELDWGVGHRAADVIRAILKKHSSSPCSTCVRLDLKRPSEVRATTEEGCCRVKVMLTVIGRYEGFVWAALLRQRSNRDREVSTKTKICNTHPTQEIDKLMSGGGFRVVENCFYLCSQWVHLSTASLIARVCHSEIYTWRLQTIVSF